MKYRKWPWMDRKTPANYSVMSDEAPSYVFETHQRSDIGNVEGMIAQYLASGWSIQPIFENAVDEVFADSFNLSCFWKLLLPGPSFHEWDESPYELAYELLERGNLKSIEPDLPSGFFHPNSTISTNICEEDAIKEPPDQGWALRNINAPQAWQILAKRGATLGSGILVGQPDTGVADHLDLEDCLDMNRSINLIELGTFPVDPLVNGLVSNPGHGTSTASVVASRGTIQSFNPPQSYGTGGPGKVTGSAPDALVVPIRAIRSVVRITQGNVAKAVDHARKSGCHIVSMSLGGLPLRALEAAILRAIQDQVIVVAAAGNCVRLIVYPARYRSVISVGGTNINDHPWKGSSRGSRIDICAPAEFVWRAYRSTQGEQRDIIKSGQGTSYATALIAGVAALWLSDPPTFMLRNLVNAYVAQEQFRFCLKKTARVPNGWDDQEFGPGIVDAERLTETCFREFAIQTPAQPSREQYAQQIHEVYEDLKATLKSVFSQRISVLANEDKEYFGHEVLTLLAQEAWLATLSESDKTAAHLNSLPILKPSIRLQKILKMD